MQEASATIPRRMLSTHRDRTAVPWVYPPWVLVRELHIYTFRCHGQLGYEAVFRSIDSSACVLMVILLRTF